MVRVTRRSYTIGHEELTNGSNVFSTWDFCIRASLTGKVWVKENKEGACINTDEPHNLI